MALPLILAAGAGILGGVDYLMGRKEKRDTQEQMGQLEQYLQSPQGQQLQQQYPIASNNMMFEAARASANSGGMLSSGQAPRQVNGLLNMAMNMTNQMEQNQIQNQMAQQQQRQQMIDPTAAANVQMATSLKNEYQEDLGGFAAQQQQMQALFNTLDNPTNLNSALGVFNLMKVLDPLSSLTESEQGVFSGSGSWGTRVANAFNKLRGGGLNDEVIREIKNAAQSQWVPRYNNAKKRHSWYQDRMGQLRGAGRNVMSPLGSLGLGDTFAGEDPTISPLTAAPTPSATNQYQSPLMLQSSGNAGVSGLQPTYVDQLIKNGMDPAQARRLQQAGAQ